MRVRTLGVAAAVACAAVGLSACKSNVGTAAVVNGHRISESTVHKYLLAGGVSPTDSAQAATAGVNLQPPRTVVVNALVQEQVFTDALSKSTGGVPTDAELRANHDAAAAALTGQSSTTGAQLNGEVATYLGLDAINQSLLPIYLRDLDLEYAMIQRTNATALSDLANFITARHVSVSVNPAYGAWDAASFVVSPDSSPPPFLVVPSASASTGS